MAETDQREDMRALAVWAIGRIAGQEAKDYIQGRLLTDSAEDVQVEGNRLLEEWGSGHAV